MSRVPVLLAAALCELAASAQFPILPLDSVVDGSDPWADRIVVEGSVDYNANSIYNELPLALYQGEFLERELRERSLGTVEDKARNSAGHVLQARISWTGGDSLFGCRHWHPLVSVAHQDQMGTTFTDDLYKVTFFGNASFEGDRADLGPSAFTQIRYQTIGAGLVEDRYGSYARLDFVHGQSIARADAEWAGVFTGTDGRVLRASVLGDFFQSDTAGSELGRTNGLGLALSGRWATVIDRFTRPFDLAFEVKDLGFASWNGNAVRIEKDTVIAFEGFEVANIFDLGDVLLGEEQLRDTFGLRYSTGGFTSPLPFQVSASAGMDIARRWHGTFAVDQRYLPGYVPQLSVSASRRCGTRALFGGSLSYGGFGGLRVGLATRIRVIDRVLLSIGTPHILGFALGSTRGAGLAFGVSVGF